MVEMVRCFFEKQVYSRSIGLYVEQDTRDGKRLIPKVVKWVEVEPNTILEDCFRLTPTAAQSMMDGLWACGIRPTEGEGSAGAMTAVQEHLKDMRRLVFDREARP